MSFDPIASVQRVQQLQQAEAAAGKRLVLQRVPTGFEVALFFVAIILAIPTFSISCILFLIYFMSLTKTYLVKNVATGEKFKVSKEDFKQYRKEFKAKKNAVTKISDL